MYETFFGLTGKPFQLTPDARFFFKSVGHQRALAYMRYGLQQAQGFIVITGDVGTGKSMLVTTLSRELDPAKLLAAKIVSSHLDHEQLLSVVAGALGLPFEGRSKAALLMDIEQFCRAAMDRGQRVVVVVDEVQNLPVDGLEELRMLSNVEYRGQPIVQSFLLGQREFRHTLRSPGLEQLRQRVIAAYHLRPLAEAEVRKYIQHRLKTVGWRDDPRIEEGVYGLVRHATGGVPRRINLLMDRLLLNCALDELHYVDEDKAREIIREVEIEVGQGPLPRDHDGDGDETSDDVLRGQVLPATAEPNPEIEALRAELNLLKQQQAAQAAAAMPAPVPAATVVEPASGLAASAPAADPATPPAMPAGAPLALQPESTHDDIAEVRQSARRWRLVLWVAMVIVVSVATAAFLVLKSKF